MNECCPGGTTCTTSVGTGKHPSKKVQKSFECKIVWKRYKSRSLGVRKESVPLVLHRCVPSFTLNACHDEWFLTSYMLMSLPADEVRVPQHLLICLRPRCCVCQKAIYLKGCHLAAKKGLLGRLHTVQRNEVLMNGIENENDIAHIDL